MYRGYRVARSGWQQLVGSIGRPIRRDASAAGTTAAKHGQIRCFVRETSDPETPHSNTGDVTEVESPSIIPSVVSKREGAKWAPAEPRRKVIFSGIQPTGVPHLGNYLGALREWKRLQDDADPNTKLLFCIVDMHALTVARPPAELLQYRREVLASLLAVGLDPDQSIIYFQSSLPEHCELQWILSCTASTGYLSRMTQWKSKLQLGEDASVDDGTTKKVLKHGLFSYPILQAADILVHRATHVPVGEDQRQHLEFARECVSNFNHTYQTHTLVAPETLISPSRRIMSLTDPLKKMSKSDPSPNSRILITDSPEDIQKKVNRALTDSIDTVGYHPRNRPGIANLIEILAAFDREGRTAAEVGKELRGQRVADLKQQVAHVLSDELAEVREKFLEYLHADVYLRKVNDQGHKRAKPSALKTMRLVREATGLRNEMSRSL